MTPSMPVSNESPPPDPKPRTELVSPLSPPHQADPTNAPSRPLKPDSRALFPPTEGLGGAPPMWGEGHSHRKTSAHRTPPLPLPKAQTAPLSASRLILPHFDLTPTK